MQDPKITLRSALISGWNANKDLDAAIDTLGDKTKEVLCSTGWYDEDFTAPQITITELTDRDAPWELGYGVIRVFCIYQIDIWVKILRLTGKGPGVAKKWLWQMRQEVKRILKENLTDLTDLQYVELNDVGRRLDEPERNLLRYSKNISVIYDLT